MKKTNYKQIFVQWPSYGEEIMCKNIKQTIVTQSSLTYVIDDILLNNNISLTPTTLFILNYFQYHNSHVNIPNFSRNRTAPFSEILSNALIPHSVMHQNKGRLSKFEKADIKEMLFRNDCARLGLNLLEDKLKYSNLLVQLSQILPEINKILMEEMEKKNFENYLELNIFSEYEHLPWGLRLLLKLSTSDKMKSPNINLRAIHDKKKVVLRFFRLQMMCHIGNAKYSSLFTMKIGDIFYNRHDDLAYSFKLFNQFGVIEAL